MNKLIEKYSKKLQNSIANRAITFDSNTDEQNASDETYITAIAEVLRDIKYFEKKSETLLIDINGKSIKKGQKFTFMFLRELNNPIKLTGFFTWNQDELRYEIDIENNEEYTSLSYINNGLMYDFKKL